MADEGTATEPVAEEPVGNVEDGETFDYSAALSEVESQREAQKTEQQAPAAEEAKSTEAPKGAPAPEAEAPAAEPQAAPEAPKDEADPEAKAEEGTETPPESAEETETETDPETVFPTFSFKADGAEHEIPGTQLGANGVFFPAEAIPDLRTRLATAHAHNNSWQEQLQSARAEGERKLQEAEAKLAGADLITAKLQELRDAGEDVAMEWWQDYSRNLPLLLAEAENAALKKQAELATTETASVREQQEWQQMQPQFDAAVETMVTQYHEAYPNANVDLLRPRLKGMYGQIFTKVDGDWKVNSGVVEDTFSFAHQVGQPVAATQKATETGQANQQKLAESPAPPTVASTSRAPAPRPTKDLPKIRSKAEWEAYIESAAADQFVTERLQQ